MSDLEAKASVHFARWVHENANRISGLIDPEDEEAYQLVKQVFTVGFRAGYSIGQSDATRKETKNEEA